MGIRPKFYIVVGIDDAKINDRRRIDADGEVIEDLLNFREMKSDEYWHDNFFSDEQYAELGVHSKYLGDRLYNPQLCNEYANGTVLGYITKNGENDSEFVRALCTIYPEFEQAGWKRIPTTKIEDGRYIIARGAYKEIDFKCNRVVSSVFEMPGIPQVEWKRAMHYLKLVGWDIPEDELRYLLVWDWS